ncbi:Vacuolar protease A [Mortierella sp. AM989]|nr:Vacuolar protease A [Mortierella sp. AM989]
MAAPIRQHVDISSSGADQFVELYYKVYDTQRPVLNRLYRDSSAILWNGNAFSGITPYQEFYNKLATSEHVVEAYDCHPLPCMSKEMLYPYVVCVIRGMFFPDPPSTSIRTVSTNEGKYPTDWPSILGHHLWRRNIKLQRNSFKPTEPNFYDGDDGQIRLGPKIDKIYPAMYTVSVHLGTPPKLFNLQLSTGTSNSWVTSSKCISPSCRLRNQFHATASSTYKSNETIAIIPTIPYRIGDTSSEYYSARLLGSIANDKVSFGFSSWRESYQFAEIIYETDGLKSELWDNDNLDGVLGMGYDPNAATGYPFFPSFAIRQALVEHIFGVYLRKEEGDGQIEGTHQGILFLGGIYPQYYVGDIQWHPVTRDWIGEWTIELTAFSLKREAFEIDGNAIIDTGFPYIALTRYQAEMINAQIGGVETSKGSGMYELPCSNIPTLFEFIVLFGEEEYQLEGHEYVFHSAKEGGRRGWGRGAICQSAIVGMDFSQESGIVAIFGEVFLRKYFSAYDLMSRRVGFALANHDINDVERNTDI